VVEGDVLLEDDDQVLDRCRRVAPGRGGGGRTGLADAVLLSATTDPKAAAPTTAVRNLDT